MSPLARFRVEDVMERDVPTIPADICGADHRAAAVAAGSRSLAAGIRGRSSTTRAPSSAFSRAPIFFKH